MIVVCVTIYVVIEEIKWAERHWDDPHYEYELKAGHGAWFNEHEYDKSGNEERLDLYGYRFDGPC